MELRRALLIAFPILGVIGLYMTCLWVQPPEGARGAASTLPASELPVSSAPVWSAPAAGRADTKVDDVSLLRREMRGRVASENAESQAGPEVRLTSALGFF